MIFSSRKLSKPGVEIQGGNWGFNKYRQKKTFAARHYAASCFQKAVTLFDFVIVMENLYSTHNICRTLLLFYLGQMEICEVKLRDFDEISTILIQHRPQNQEYRPFEQNGRLSTNGR